MSRVTRADVDVVDGRRVVVRLTIEDPEGIAAADLRSVTLGGFLAPPLDTDAEALRRLRDLGRPLGPGSWWDAYADAYRYAATVTQRPNRAIAEALGVPVTTVARWTYVARRRGALEPVAEVES